MDPRLREDDESICEDDTSVKKEDPGIPQLVRDRLRPG